MDGEWTGEEGETKSRTWDFDGCPKKMTDQCSLAEIDKRIDVVLRTQTRDLTSSC